jgi:hypothetical protein
MKTIRRQMLQGQWPSACERGRGTEQAGGVSRRRQENACFAPHIGQILEETDASGETTTRTRSIDDRPGNLCNLRCRMCHPSASKLLLDEWNKATLCRDRIDKKKARCSSTWTGFSSRDSGRSSNPSCSTSNTCISPAASR